MPAAPDLTKAEQLRVAGFASPRLRTDAHLGRVKRVHVVDASGAVVGELTSVELAAKVLARAGIELDLEPGSALLATQRAAEAARMAMGRKSGKGGNFADPVVIALAKEMRRKGLSMRDIHAKTGLGRETLARYLAPISKSEAMRRMHVRRAAEGKAKLLPPRRQRRPNPVEPAPAS